VRRWTAWRRIRRSTCHVDRGDINRQLLAWGRRKETGDAGEVQVVTITDEGQEITQDIACVERQERPP